MGYTIIFGKWRAQGFAKGRGCNYYTHPPDVRLCCGQEDLTFHKSLCQAQKQGKILDQKTNFKASMRKFILFGPLLKFLVLLSFQRQVFTCKTWRNNNCDIFIPGQ